MFPYPSGAGLHVGHPGELLGVWWGCFVQWLGRVDVRIKRQRFFHPFFSSTPRGLHRHRHRGPPQAHDGAQRAASNRVGRVRPARRTVRDPDGATPRQNDGNEYRAVSGPTQIARLLLRLGPGGGHHRPGLLQVDAVDLFEAVGKGAGVPGRGRKKRREREEEKWVDSVFCFTPSLPPTRSLSTGAPPWAPSSPTRKSSTASPNAATTPSCANR